ncbi:helix-turn-helix domain-containing protein [Amorphus sp. 3PC139-8]|uniref:helix-turn-helix domain-containing protein n=1 Tax=Amorphus sp. 3PC139-8 TaxID=2735676 RepID=UPI00345DDF26
MLQSHLLDRSESTYSALSAPDEAMPDASLRDVFLRLGGTILVERNGEIYADGEPAEHVYEVMSGVVRICSYLEDGRRQICAFHFPGDVFGFELDEVHAFSAEAVTPCKLAMARKSAFKDAASREPTLCAAMCRTVATSFAQLQAHVVLLGHKSAQQRVTAFLKALTRHHANAGVVELPMSRQDIADHLGLTIETVSRTITQLQDLGVISLEGSRKITVRRRQLAA